MGVPYTVDLFPKRHCTCACKGICYHILAVQMAIKLSNTATKRPGNTSLLRRNVKMLATEKRSGRKKPRPKDVRNRDRVNYDPDDAYYDAYEPEFSEEDREVKRDEKDKIYPRKKPRLVPNASAPVVPGSNVADNESVSAAPEENYIADNTESTKFKAVPKKRKLAASKSDSLEPQNSSQKPYANTNLVDIVLENDDLPPLGSCRSPSLPFGNDTNESCVVIGTSSEVI